MGETHARSAAVRAFSDAICLVHSPEKDSDNRANFVWKNLGPEWLPSLALRVRLSQRERVSSAVIGFSRV